MQNPQRPAPKGVKGPHSVEAWGVRFGVPKPAHEDWSQFSPEMLHRCTQDVEIQHRILQALMTEARGKNWTEAHKMTAKLFEILQLQEDYGWLVDQPHMHHCVGVLTRRIERIDKVLEPIIPMTITRAKKVKGEYAYYKKPFQVSGQYQTYVLDYLVQCGYDVDGRVVAGPFSRVAFDPVDLNSNEQTKDYLLSQGWLPKEYNYSKITGEQTSPKLKHDEPFEGIVSGIGRLIARRVQARHRRSQIVGWFKVIRPDGRISQGISGIATTGRLKHQRIVNVPGNDSYFGKQMRKIFIAKEGYKIVGVDSAGCQNRMLAARVNDPAFTEILLNGTKEKRNTIHYVNQAAILKHAGFEPSYKVSKNLNYAFMFGAQDKKLSAVASVPEGVGPLIRKGLLSISPGFEKLMETLTAEWKSTAKKSPTKWGVKYHSGYIIGLDGRPVLIEKEHTLLVFTLQSDEAIMMQYALLFLYKWLCQRGWVHGREYGFVANVHDELQAEVREDLADEYAALARQAITTAGEFLKIACPHQGESEVGNNWYETH